jgi:enterochelin esterase-like enzyme
VRLTAGLTLALVVTACAAPSAGVGAPAPAVTASPVPAPSNGTPSSASPGASPTARALGKGRVDKGTFHSNALNRTMSFLVYLPPGYDANPKGRYATAYALHGGSGFITEWVDYGLLDAADRLMGSGEIRPFVIVLPQGDQEYWVDHVIDRRTGANGEKWGTYTAKEVVAAIDQRYRTIASPPARAIGGTSMGGHGAMQLALNFPGIWSAIAATSPSIRPEGEAPTYLGFGTEFAARDPLSLVRSKPELAHQYAWWIDTGRLDPWLRPARAIHEELDALGVPHEWQTPPGGHDAPYWSAHVEDYLRFYASVLCRDPAACPVPP